MIDTDKVFKDYVFFTFLFAGIIFALGLLITALRPYESPYKGKCELTEKFPQKRIAAYRCEDNVIYWEQY